MENKENKKIDNEYQGQGWNRMSTRMFDDFHHQQHLQQHQNIHNSMVNDFHHTSFPSSVSTFHTEWSTTLTSGGDGWSISYTNVNKPALFVMAIYFALLIFSWLV
ncbi:hypothetical protein BJ944DRAFT_241624 [Cunninghamella echinulata]|nr:hypothetical protein BJ944DRAFT_241624 [Cunninghamella echinulata]